MQFTHLEMLMHVSNNVVLCRMKELAIKDDEG